MNNVPDGDAEPRVRLKSLDVMRGFAVVGMIFVNALAYTNEAYGLKGLGFLAHAPWAGFTFADFVFPAFVFMVGVSIAASFREAQGIDRPLLMRVSARTLRLFVLGFVISNIPWTAPFGDWRWLGVLQRIGACYFAAALFFAATGWRTRAVVAVLLLAVSWVLLMLPVAGGVDLTKPGANVFSWVDRLYLGRHAYVAGPNGYDPEGLLSTLAAVAQCLLGTLAGEWILSRRQSPAAMGKLACVGAALVCSGLSWSLVLPLVKNLWTASFVLLSTGIAAIMLAGLVWLLDIRRTRIFGTGFFEAFGLNAILAYAVENFAQLIPSGGGMQNIAAAGTKSGLETLSVIAPVVLFIFLLWLPLELMRRKRWVVKI